MTTVTAVTLILIYINMFNSSVDFFSLLIRRISARGTMYPTTMNLTEIPSPDPWLTKLSVGELVGWCLPCGFAAIASIFGNTLVLVSFFMSSNLRYQVTFFVAGLAAADVLVGLISIPMWMYMLYLAWKGHSTSGNSMITTMFDVLDVFAALNSIFHLTAVSIERFFATIYPWRHRRATQRMYHVFLTGIWITSALVSSSFFLPVSKLTIDFRFYLINILFVIPLLIMSVTYAGIWFKAKTRLRKATDTTLKMSFTLFIVIGLFFVAWLPFFVVRAVLHFCKHYCVSWRIFYVTKLLHFSNSAVNPLVYGLRIPEYRDTFLKLLGLKSVIPTRDSIELDSLAVKNSPRSFGDNANGSVDTHGNKDKVTRPTDDNCARRASLPVITITTPSEVVTRSKSQDLFSSRAIL